MHSGYQPVIEQRISDCETSMRLVFHAICIADENPPVQGFIDHIEKVRFQQAERTTGRSAVTLI
jgi:hypothetical protein